MFSEMGSRNNREDVPLTELTYPVMSLQRKPHNYHVNNTIYSPEVIKFITAIQSCDPQNNLFHYLIIDDQGSKANLDKIIVQVEKEIGTVLKTIVNDLDSNRLWEIPTRELCEGLLDLFRFFGINTIVEAGAGLGLLSACLHHYSDVPLNLETHTPSHQLSTWHGNSFTYCRTVNATFAKMMKVRDTSPEAIVVSWIHNDYETELLISIVENSINYVFLIGVGAPGDDVYMCQSDTFHEKMTCNLDYYYAIVPIKQVCRQDYFIYDTFKKVEDYGESSRSCVVVYIRSNIAKQIIETKAPQDIDDSINFPMVRRRARLFRDKFRDNEIKLPRNSVKPHTLGKYTPFTVDYMMQDSVILKRLSDMALHNIERTINASKSKL